MKLADRIFQRADWKLTSPYGTRIHPVTRIRSFHYGCDYGTKAEKWPQYALENGVVLSCGKDPVGLGAIFAWVSYPRLGIKVLHYHLDRLMVTKGQQVNENTVIGTTGQTGRATGIHLHLGVKHLADNKYFDPESYEYIPPDNDDMGDLVQITEGDMVKITGTNYSTGQKIPAWVKLKPYRVTRVQGEKALLGTIQSWVNKKDLKKL